MYISRGSKLDLLAQSFTGANSLIISGGLPLSIAVRIFFSCSVQGIEIVSTSKVDLELNSSDAL